MMRALLARNRREERERERERERESANRGDNMTETFSGQLRRTTSVKLMVAVGVDTSQIQSHLDSD